jgi:hypothetical protein
MDVSEFIYKWERADLNEKAAFQTYFNDLCELVGHEPPIIADPEGKSFRYEKFVIKSVGGTGFVDAAYKGKFVWEHKSKGEDLDEAYRQALNYVRALGNPPLIVVGDFERIIIHTNFNNTEYTTYQITLKELGENLHLIEPLFYEPERLKPSDVQSNLADKPRLTIRFDQVEPVRMWSDFGLVEQYGGRAPDISGITEYQIILTNSSYRTARLITVDLSIDVTILNRPELERQYESHYRFTSSADTYCLSGDEIILDPLEFWAHTNGNSPELEEMIQQAEKENVTFDWKTGKEKAIVHAMKLNQLKNPGGFGTISNDGIQRELLSLYHRNPAKDVYTLNYEVRAEGFAAFQATDQIEIYWSNHK